ncbi:MAG: sensor histidine kinase, partial [Bacteroidota bacterium]
SINLTIKNMEPCYGDPSMIRQVITNLMSNAIKYSQKEEKPEIEVFSENKDGMVVYCIRDNGVGFDMKYKEKLFGVFQRLHSENDFEGTGVGLAIVQRIVHRHGGSIDAVGSPGHGATFWFSLPVENETKEMINKRILKDVNTH